MTANLFLYGGMIVITYFTVRYGTRSKWWRYPEGVALFLLAASLSSVSLAVAATLWLGQDYPGRQVVRHLVFGAFFCASVFLVGAFERRQGKWRRERRALLDELLQARLREERDGLSHRTTLTEVETLPVPVVIMRRRHPLRVVMAKARRLWQ